MKIGLALSGGGVRGAGHIGVIKALIENNIEIFAIGGTSIGSIVAGLFAMNYNTDEMLKLFKYFSKNIIKLDPKYYWSNVKNMQHFMGYGLLSSQNIELAMNECAKLKQIENIKDIKMPIVLPTVDIIKNKKYIFTNIENEENKKFENCINNITIGKAVRASSSYPGIFSPTIVNNCKFVDGGVLDNLPAEEVRKLGVDKVISVRFNCKNETDPKNAIDVLMKSIDLIFEQRKEEENKSSDYTITLDLTEVNVFDIKKIEYCYNEGYKEALKRMNTIKALIEK